VRIQQIEKNARNARTIRSFDSSFLSRTRPTIARSNASQSDATRGVNILTFTVFFPSRCATDAFKALACLVGDARNKLPRELLISLVEFRDPGRRGRSPPTLVRVKIASTINVSFDVARSRARRRCELRGHFNILTTSSRGAVLSFPHVRIGCFVKGTRPNLDGTVRAERRTRRRPGGAAPTRENRDEGCSCNRSSSSSSSSSRAR